MIAHPKGRQIQTHLPARLHFASWTVCARYAHATDRQHGQIVATSIAGKRPSARGSKGNQEDRFDSAGQRLVNRGSTPGPAWNRERRWIRAQTCVAVLVEVQHRPNAGWPKLAPGPGDQSYQTQFHSSVKRSTGLRLVCPPPLERAGPHASSLDASTGEPTSVFG